MDGHAKFALCRQNACDPAAAAHSHILGQGDFRRHHEGQFDRIAFRHLEIGVEERSASAQILGEAAALAFGSCQPNSDRELEVEALRRAALKVNLIGAHDFSDTRRSNIGLLRRGDIEGDYLRIAGNSRVDQGQPYASPDQLETPGQADVELRILYSTAERYGSWKFLQPAEFPASDHAGGICRQKSCGQHSKQRDWNLPIRVLPTDLSGNNRVITGELRTSDAKNGVAPIHPPGLTPP